MARKIFSCFISLLLCLLVAMPAYAQYGNAGQDRSKLPVAHKKKKEKERARKLKLILSAQEEARKDSVELEKYKEKYLLRLEKQKIREEKRAARKKVKPQQMPGTGEAMTKSERNEKKL